MESRMSFFSDKKIRIDKDLYGRLKAAALRAGYALTEEFIQHVLEREAGGLEELSDVEQAERQLRGLGYLK